MVPKYHGLTDSGGSIIKQAVKTVETFDRTFFAQLGSETGTFNRQLLVLL